MIYSLMHARPILYAYCIPSKWSFLFQQWPCIYIKLQQMLQVFYIQYKQLPLFQLTELLLVYLLGGSSLLPVLPHAKV